MFVNSYCCFDLKRKKKCGTEEVFRLVQMSKFSAKVIVEFLGIRACLYLLKIG